MSLSLKKLIVMMLVIVGIIPILGISFYSVKSLRTQMEGQIFHQNEMFLSLTANQVDRLFEDADAMIAFYTNDKQVIDALDNLKTNGKSTETLRGVSSAQVKIGTLLENSDFTSVTILDTSGNMITSSDPKLASTDFSKKDYVASALRGETAYSYPYYNDDQNLLYLDIVAPVYNTKKDLVGGVLVQLNSDAIETVMHNDLNVLGESADTYLFNVDGLLYSNTDKEGYRFNSVLVDTITTEGTTNLSSLISEGDLETVQTRIYQGYHENDGLVIGSSKVIQFGNEYIGVIVELSEEEALGQVDLVSKTLFIVAGVVLLLGIIIGFLIIRAIVVPVNQVTKAAKNVAKGNMNVSLDKVLKRKDELGILAQSFKQVIDSNVEKAELIEYIALGELDKVEVKDTTDHVFKSILTVKENLEMFSSHVREDSKSILNGQFTEVIKDTGLSGIYADLISDVNNVMDGFKEKFDYLTTPFFIIDTDLTFIYANKSFEEMINHNLTDILGHPYYEYIGGINSVKEQTDGYKAINENRAINGNESLILDDEDYHVSFSISPITDQERQVVGAFATINDNTEITNQSVKLEKQKKFQEEQVKRLLSNIKTLSKGKFDMNFTEVAYDEDTREIHSLFAEIDTNLEESVNAISSYVAEISEVLTELSHSNLDLEVTREYIGEFGSIKDALNSIIESFNAVITNIYSTSNHVSGNAKSMNTSSVNLAQGATEQAAAIEEISATVTQVAAQINENAKNAQEVNEHARDAVLSAEQSNMMMSELTKAMKDVQKSTTNIQKVLKMINDISFQTNILSLNAAVEAARAGQHGKGFAVIAEDVRNLALKSANAADETTDMLDSIVSKINDAVKYANETATSLIEIVTNSKQSVDISSQVAVASNEQATAVAQINLSLDQISSVVQTTSSNAKDSEDVSKDLAHMSNQLMEVVSEFNTKGSLKKVQKQESFEEQPVITKQDDEDEIILNLDDLSF